MRIRLVLAFSLAAFACGPDNNNQPGGDARTGDARSSGGDAGGSGSGSGNLDIYQSGTRIKMKVLTTPDGAKEFRGWRDTLRNEDCNFGPAPDGVTRCLPVFGAMVTASYYGDASCTVPVGISYPGCQPPTYVALPSAVATCALQQQPVGAIYARGTAYSTYYTKSGSTCSAPSTFPAGSGYSLYGIAGAEIPPTSFQSATLDVE